MREADDGTLEGYQNCIERDFPLEGYYGKSLPRLKRVKNDVDPNNVFVFPQPIPCLECNIGYASWV